MAEFFRGREQIGAGADHVVRRQQLQAYRVLRADNLRRGKQLEGAFAPGVQITAAGVRRRDIVAATYPRRRTIPSRVAAAVGLNRIRVEGGLEIGPALRRQRSDGELELCGSCRGIRVSMLFARS